MSPFSCRFRTSTHTISPTSLARFLPNCYRVSANIFSRQTKLATSHSTFCYRLWGLSANISCGPVVLKFAAFTVRLPTLFHPQYNATPPARSRLLMDLQVFATSSPPHIGDTSEVGKAMSHCRSNAMSR